MKYKEFNDLPIVRPATALKSNYQDTHMQATYRSAEDSERLDKILAHYEKDLEKKANEQITFEQSTANPEETVQI